MLAARIAAVRSFRGIACDASRWLPSRRCHASAVRSASGFPTLQELASRAGPHVLGLHKALHRVWGDRLLQTDFQSELKGHAVRSRYSRIFSEVAGSLAPSASRDAAVLRALLQNYAIAVTLLFVEPAVEFPDSRVDMARLLTRTALVDPQSDTSQLAECWFGMGCALLTSSLEDGAHVGAIYLDAALAARLQLFLALAASDRTPMAYESSLRVLQTRRLLANSLVLGRSFDAALSVLGAGMREAPNAYSRCLYLFDMGFCLMKSGEYLAALSRIDEGTALWSGLPRTQLAADPLPAPVFLHAALCYAALRLDDRAHHMFQEGLRAATAECGGNAFHPTMEVIYEHYHRFLKRRLGKKWSEEARRIRLAMEQVRKGARPLEVSG